MKKKLSIQLMIFLSGFLFAQAAIKNVLVVSSGQNLSTAENVWLIDSVRDKFESNIQTYTSYQVVSSNEKKIKELQKKSENIGFDEESVIEIGKLVSADHAFFLTTRKGDSLYTVTAELTNLTTGKQIAKSVSKGKSKTDELFNVSGSAVDEIIIELCEKLGQPLSNSQKFILLKGSFDAVSDKEQLAMFNQELSNFDRQIKNFDIEIAKLMKSNDLDAITKKNKLESEKALAEQRKKNIEANKARLAEIEIAKKEEAAANAGRSAEQQKKILELSNEVNAKAAELRKTKMDNLSAFGKIKVLESKKAALIDIRGNVRKEQRFVPEKYNKEYEAKIAAVKNAPWRTAEKNDDGTPAKEAIEERDRKVEKLKKECGELILSEQKKIAEATYDSQIDVIKEILMDQDGLKDNVFYANTLNKNLRVSIGNYGRNRDGWVIKYAVLCDGLEITSGEGILQFSVLDNALSSGMEKFDAIDMYDSLFKCGEPVLTFGCSYKICDIDDKISTYKFDISEIAAYDTKTVSVDMNGKIAGEEMKIAGAQSIEKQMKPLNDWKK